LKISNNKLPISAIVVGFNEANLLDRCLSSISFCSELIYTDLYSTDSSVTIAKKFGARVIYKKSDECPYCEIAQSDMVELAKNDWILFIDPDEYILDDLVAELKEVYLKVKASEEIGAVLVPWVFYFKDHRLKGTIWGGFNKKYILVNKHRFEFNTIIHYGRKLKNGFSIFEIFPDARKENYLYHQWATSIYSFLEKHNRYLRFEGDSLKLLGVKVSFYKVLLAPIREFYFCYIQKRGFRDNFIGLFLSLFWAYYRTVILIDIYKLNKYSKL
jgi:glycosyltransferase involved in cell wall biosynthesis